MAKQAWKPGSLLAPVPAVLVTVRSKEGQDNILTIAWAGTVCSSPAMVSISVRPERYSYPILKETGEFVINLVTKDMIRAADYCGVKSGRDEDKFAACGLHKEPAGTVSAPILKESPLALECKVEQVIPLGSHDLFIARVTQVDVDEALMDENGRLKLEEAGLVSYVHGEYYAQGARVGTFGYSVKKK